MLRSRPTSDRPVTLRAAIGASLLAGAVSGGGTFAMLHFVDGPASSAAVRDAPPVVETPGLAPTSPVADTSAVEALQDALETAEAERSQLAGTLLSLNRRAEALETRLTTLAAAVDANAASAPPDGEPVEGIVAGEQGHGLGGEERRNADDARPDSLVAAGLDPASAADIRRRRDEFQLARLELIDRATREGWADSERLGESLETLEERRPDLREELGDDAYDRYLFEEGSRNRVGIASVISGSAADVAGLAPGDIVLSYAGSRMFGSRELQSATRAGERGEYVQLGVLRDGEIVAVDVPRGPLGVTLEGLRRPPG